MSTKRTNRLHEKNRQVGIKRVDLGLDPIAKAQLDELVDASGYANGEKGGRNGILTFAIDYLHGKFTKKEKGSKKKRQTAPSKKKQQTLIAKHIVTAQFEQCRTEREVLKNLAEFPVPIDGKDSWTLDLINNLSEVELKGNR
jgi:hypothetical protein